MKTIKLLFRLKIEIYRQALQDRFDPTPRSGNTVEIMNTFSNFARYINKCHDVLGRILAIDYGTKRVGLAVTDPLQLIASRLDTVASNGIWAYLADYFKRETVDAVIIGFPLQLNNQPSSSVVYLESFLKTFAKRYPGMPLHLVDERFTSKLAHMTMIDAGLKKTDRQNKALVDGISATIILQSWLEKNRYSI
jgi:putative holliday junction resolvase